jgi:hypothetical protein
MAEPAAIRRPSHDEDFYAWTQDQAVLLREMADRRVNTPLDLENLAEEIEDLGRNDYHATRSYVRRIIGHLLKYQFSHSDRDRPHWKGEIATFRNELESRLTRSLENKVRAELEVIYQRAVTEVVAAMEDGEPDFEAKLPEGCPYPWEEIVEPTGWLPVPDPGAAPRQP